MMIIMQNEAGITKRVKDGFSWTTFFFGWIPSLVRGDIVSTIKLFILGVISLGAYSTYKSLDINQDYKELLIEKGYREVGREGGGFPSLRVLEIVLVWLKILIPFFIVALIICGYLNVLFNIPKIMDNNTSFESEYVNNNDQGNEIIIPKEKKKENTNDNVVRNDSVANSTFYKSGVTNNQLNDLYNLYNRKLSDITSQYGSSYREYGTPIYNDGGSTDLERANDYFNKMDNVLNEQWASLKSVLNEGTFLKLQKEQIAWIKKRDEVAKQNEENVLDEAFKEISYITTKGKETEKRIIELSKNYFLQ